MSKNVYKDSAFGIGLFNHCYAADSYQGGPPTFKTDLALTGADADALKAEFDAAAKAAWDDFWASEAGQKIPAGKRKDWTQYAPYEEEVDDKSGEPTGRTIFKFRQNESIKLRDGTIKHVVIGIYDASGETEVKQEVNFGSTIRVRYSLRPFAATGLKLAGVRADFAMVQVKRMAEKSGGGGGFGAVDGYTADPDAEAAPKAGFGAADGDY